MWGLAPLAVLNCTTVARGVLTHATSYQLGVCMWVWSLPYVSHTHLHSVPRLNPALTVDRGGPPPPSASDNPSKPPCLEQKEPVVAVAYFSCKAFLPPLYLSLPPFTLLRSVIHWKRFFFFYALTRKEKRKKKRIEWVAQGQIKAFLEQCSFFLVTWARSYRREARQFNLVEAGCRLGSVGALGGRTVGAAACFITPDLYLSCTWSWIPT